MPGPTIGSDKCQEDKCQDLHLFRTNARRTNAWMDHIYRVSLKKRSLRDWHQALKTESLQVDQKQNIKRLGIIKAC